MRWWKINRVILTGCMAFVLAASAGCGEGGITAGREDVLAKDQMALLLADMQLVESVLRISANEIEINVDTIDYFVPVFEKHQVSREQFKQSMEYYSGQPALLEEIYDAVLVKLSEQQAGYEGVEVK